MAGSPQIVLSAHRRSTCRRRLTYAVDRRRLSTDAPNREDNKWKENRVAKILLEIESPIQGLG
jgi:hypothetical protein